jgi:hypothetical protein
MTLLLPVAMHSHTLTCERVYCSFLIPFVFICICNSQRCIFNYFLIYSILLGSCNLNPAADLKKSSLLSQIFIHFVWWLTSNSPTPIGVFVSTFHCRTFQMMPYFLLNLRQLFHYVHA